MVWPGCRLETRWTDEVLIECMNYKVFVVCVFALCGVGLCGWRVLGVGGSDGERAERECEFVGCR